MHPSNRNTWVMADTLTHILSQPCVFPRQYVILRQDSTSSSRQVLSEGSVWRGHPDRNRRNRGSLPFMMLQSPVKKKKKKTLCCASAAPLELMLLANVVDIFVYFLVVVFCALPLRPSLIPVNFLSGNFYLSLSPLPRYKTHLRISLILSPMWSSSSRLSAAALPPLHLPPSHFLCLCLTAGVFLKNNKLRGCVCACVLRLLHRLDGLATLGWLLVWSPGKLYDLFS